MKGSRNGISGSPIAWDGRDELEAPGAAALAPGEHCSKSESVRLTHRLAAEAIRRHFWRPEAPGPLGGRPWTMARELRIFDGLARHRDPLELIGAIGHVRDVTGTLGPIRMTWLIHRQRGAARLSRAVAAFHASQAAQPPTGPPRGGGFGRISVELPPLNHLEDAP